MIRAQGRKEKREKRKERAEEELARMKLELAANQMCVPVHQAGRQAACTRIHLPRFGYWLLSARHGVGADTQEEIQRLAGRTPGHAGIELGAR